MKIQRVVFIALLLSYAAVACMTRINMNRRSRGTGEEQETLPTPVQFEARSELPQDTVLMNVARYYVRIQDPVVFKYQGAMMRATYNQGGKWMTYPELNPKKDFCDFRLKDSAEDVTVAAADYEVIATEKASEGGLLLNFPAEDLNMKGIYCASSVDLEKFTYADFLQYTGNTFKFYMK